MTDHLAEFKARRNVESYVPDYADVDWLINEIERMRGLTREHIIDAVIDLVSDRLRQRGDIE